VAVLVVVVGLLGSVSIGQEAPSTWDKAAKKVLDAAMIESVGTEALAKHKGKITYAIKVDATGAVVSSTPIRQSGAPIVDGAVRRAISRFKPDRDERLPKPPPQMVGKRVVFKW